MQNQDIYLNSNVLQNQPGHFPLDSSISCSIPTTSSNRSQQSIDFLTGYPTIVDPSTSTAMCANSGTNTVAVAAAAAAAAATVVNHEVLEGLKRIADKYKRIRATYDAYKNDYSSKFYKTLIIIKLIYYE